MKTLSLKVLGCAAALTLLTNARAQDDVQAVPPPDTNVQATDTAPAQQQQVQPPVVIMQVPADGGANVESNNNDAQQEDNGQGAQPMQNNQPNQQFRYNQGGQNQGGQNRFNNNGNDRGGRNRGNFGNRGDFGGQQRGGINSVPVGDSSNFMPPPTGSTNGTDGLILNFRDTQIDQVLNYLSDAAGFIIELDTHVSGTVSVWSAHPVSRNDAVTILNSALAKNGYAVIQAGRILRVMSKEDALHEVPVVVEGDPNMIPQTGDTVTQIIPVRNVSARQLISDLSLLTPSTSTIMANDAGNSIIITDTQQNIHHLAELIKAIDGSAEDVTEVKVFHLQYHDPVEVAALLTSIFVDQGGQNGGQSAPIRFGGLGGLAALGGFGGGGGGFGGRGGGGGFGGRGGGGGGLAQFFGGGGRGGQGGQQGGGNQSSVRPRAKVVAVADQRMQSVLVTAPKDVMAQVEEVVEEVDKESPKVAQVTVVPLINADPTVVLKALQDFQANNGRSTTSQQTSILTTRAAGALNSSSSSGFGTSSSGFGGGGGSGFGGGGGGGFGGGGGSGFRGGGQ